MNTKLKFLDYEYLPREKLLAGSAGALSDVELLAVLLGTGTKGKDVFKLATELLPEIDKLNGSLQAKNLLSIVGLGPAKACLIAAAFEFVRRRVRPRGQKITKAQDVLALVSHLAHRPQEHFVSISLNGAHEVIASRVLTIGLVNSSQIHPREVFSSAITDRATAIIIAHNHPSGNLTPSDQDKIVTEKLKNSGEILGIKLLDHVIFAAEGYFSFKENGLI